MCPGCPFGHPRKRSSSSCSATTGRHSAGAEREDPISSREKGELQARIPIATPPGDTTTDRTPPRTKGTVAVCPPRATRSAQQKAYVLLAAKPSQRARNSSKNGRPKSRNAAITAATAAGGAPTFEPLVKHGFLAHGRAPTRGAPTFEPLVKHGFLAHGRAPTRGAPTFETSG